MTTTQRNALFAAVVAGAILAAGVSLWRALMRSQDAAAPDARIAAIAALPPPDSPFFLFRWTAAEPAYGALAFVDAQGGGIPRRIADLNCLRVHMAGERGVCLASRGGTEFRARLFDRRFHVYKELPLGGVPSRVQVAPDGRLAAATVFVSGHAYTDVGFSTQTSILDMTAGTFLVENLEAFTVRRNESVIRSIDFNFWGVTFTRDGRQFYATLGTKGETLLLRGDVGARTADVIEANVECPSLSPDNRRIAFKQRVANGAGPVAWEIWVLDLQTRARRRLPENQSVDDQLHWLDDERIVYARPSATDRASTDEWVVRADGSGAATRFLANAYSGSLVSLAGTTSTPAPGASAGQ